MIEANVKPKSAITLTLSNGSLSQVIPILDDDYKTARELWSGMDEIYRMSNTQMVINLQRGLEKLNFKKDEEWENHIQNFHPLVCKLVSYENPITMDEKVSNLVRTLLEQFGPIVNVVESSTLNFEQLFASIQAGISRRNTKVVYKVVQPISASVVLGNKSKGSNNSEKISKFRRNICFICGKQGHFATNFWYQSYGGKEG